MNVMYSRTKSCFIPIYTLDVGNVTSSVSGGAREERRCRQRSRGMQVTYAQRSHM